MAARKDQSIQGRAEEISVQMMSRTFSGPLPPPELLERYNQVLPGAAERIIAMAEKQQEHRQTIERNVIFGNTASQTRGNYLGFIVCMTAILGGIWLIYLGRETIGLAAVIAPITGLVAIFVVSKYQQKKELDAKASSLKRPTRR